MPRPITTRSTIGKRYAPVKEVSKTTFRNGKVVRTTVTSRTLPSGEIQRASSQRVTYVAGPVKPQYQAPKTYARIPSYQPTPPIRQGIPRPNKRQMPVNNIDDAYGGYLVQAPPPRISSAPKPRTYIPQPVARQPQKPYAYDLGSQVKKAAKKTGEVFYNASPFGVAETIIDLGAKEVRRQREIKFAKQGRGGIFGVGDVTPKDTRRLTDDFYFGPEPSYDIAENATLNRPTQKLKIKTDSEEAYYRKTGKINRGEKYDWWEQFGQI